MKTILLMIAVLFTKFSKAQATINDYDGVFSYKDSDITFTLNLKKVYWEAFEKNVIKGNTFYVKNGIELINQRNSLKVRTKQLDVNKYNSEVTYTYDTESSSCFLYFNEVGKIMVLKKLNSKEYLLEYSELITKEYSKNIQSFERIVPRYTLPDKIILLKRFSI